tara:strand:- start:647 stop:820 length:174 start_codon:yes stop_codon:yes gene_type:complete
MFEVSTTAGDQWYILAENLEEAAWKAAKLAGGTTYLKDVTLSQPNYLKRNVKETRFS